MTYYARSANANGQKETVTHHLTRAGELCAQFLSPLGYEDWGKALGGTHDFGKLSLCFDSVLKHQKTGVNHALPGAVLLTAMYGSRSVTAHLLAAVAASHHSDLHSYDHYADSLEAAYTGTGKNLDGENREYSLFGPEEYRQAMTLWRKDFTPKRRLSSSPALQGEEDALLSKMLFQRFLFSALVDADWSSSAEHFEPDYLAQHTGPALDPETALQRLLDIRREKQQGSTASPTLNRMRDELFDVCLAAGDEAPGLFTLTAPHRSGKDPGAPGLCPPALSALGQAAGRSRVALSDPH